MIQLVDGIGSASERRLKCIIRTITSNKAITIDGHFLFFWIVSNQFWKSPMSTRGVSTSIKTGKLKAEIKVTLDGQILQLKYIQINEYMLLFWSDLGQT